MNSDYPPEKPLLKYNKAKETADFEGILTIINLGDDTIPSPELYLPENLKERSVLFLDSDGEWKVPLYTKTCNGIKVNLPSEFCEPIYLKFK